MDPSACEKYIKDTRRFSWTNKSTGITLLTIVNIVYFYLHNNTPSKAIVNAASNITYRPLIEADDTGR